MTLVVECRPDEALAEAIGVSRGQVEHFLGKGKVGNRLSKLNGATGMVDEDPGITPSSYFQSLAPVTSLHGINLRIDRQRGNRIVFLDPRLEEWLVSSAKQSRLKMTDFGFGSDNGIQLHAEINGRLTSLKNLVAELLAKKNERILYLQSLLVHT